MRASARTAVLAVVAACAAFAAAVAPAAVAQAPPGRPGFEVEYHPAGGRFAQGSTIEATGRCPGSTNVFGALSRTLGPDTPVAYTFDRRNTTAAVADDGSFSFALVLRADQLPGRYDLSVACFHHDAGQWTVDETVQVTGTDPRPAFEDVPAGSLHAEAIRTLAWHGITVGCGAGSFCPNEVLTRAQLASLLDRAVGLDHERPPQPRAPREPVPPPFRDVPPGSTHADAIGRLAARGVIRGCDVDRFCPSLGTRRDQAASLFWRYFRFGDIDNGHPGFRDVSRDSVHARAVSTLANLDLMVGCAEGRFCPGRTLTRAQAARLLHRMLQLGT